MGKWKIIEKCIEEHKQGYYKPGKAQIGNSSLIRITDLTDEGYINLESAPKIFVEDKDLNNFSILKGDFLFARTGGAGKFGLALKKVNGVFASYLIRFRFKEELNIFFLRYFFQSEIFQSDLKSRIHGGVNQNVHAEDIKKCLLPLFTNKEQQRIVAKLDGLFAKIDQAIGLLEENIAHTQALMGSVLDEEFGKLEEVSTIMPLKDVVDNLDGKRIPIKASERKTANGVYPYYGASGVIDYVEDYIFDEETLLISEDGANLVVRKYPIAFIADGKYWVNNHAHVVKAKTEITSNEYLKYYIAHIDISGFITGSAQPKLSQRKMNEIKILIPSLEKQKEVVQKFKRAQFQIHKLEETQTQKLNHLKALKSSLLDQAFKGDL